MRKALWILLLGALPLVSAGCFSGPNFTPSDSECLHRCSKCGKRVLMLNSLLRGQSCAEGGTHHWRYNLD